MTINEVPKIITSRFDTRALSMPRCRRNATAIGVLFGVLRIPFV